MAENKFDGLTIKCIEEIPTLVEVLCSTGKVIEETFSSYYGNLRQLITDKLPKRYWKISEKGSDQILYYPLVSYPEKKIPSLSNDFYIISVIRVEKKINGKVKNAFQTHMGFWYDIDQDVPKRRFYFYLATDGTKKSNTFNDLSFYEKIIKDNPSNNFIIRHPELTPEEGDESIEIYCEEINTNKIEEIYNVFKDKVAKPFIENLK